jgi:DNA-directed RNA polymerase subunit M/transcription elongation factor TFIIS
MIKIKGRRKCANCGKRYNFYYTRDKDSDKAIYKGKEENASLASNVKVLSMYSYEVTVHCPECNTEEIFIYTE